MNYSNIQNSCEHQLIFNAVLDDAASCARCGAIVLITRKDMAVQIKWVVVPHDLSGHTRPEITTCD